MASFETVVDEYDAARPAYPAALYDHIETATGGLIGKLVADGEQWFEDYYRLLEARCPGVSRTQRDTDWSRDSIAGAGQFESIAQMIVPWVRAVSIEMWMRDQRSHSYVIALPEPDRGRLLGEAEAILHAGFPDGQMAVAYQCRLWLARRR